MKNKNSLLSFILLFVFFTSSSFSQKLLTVEDIFGTSKFASKTLEMIQWTPDNRAFTYFMKDEKTDRLFIKRVDLKTGKKTILIDSKKVKVLEEPRGEKRFTLNNYFWSPNGKYILLPSGNDIFLFDIKMKKVRQLTHDKAEERDPRFSPDSKKIAYLKNHNLFVLNIASGKESQLTNQGTENLLIGRFDWVYEEEFGIRTGFFWSPDSKHIAYFQLDQSCEPEFPIVDFIPIHNKSPKMRYPNPGDANAIVKIGVVPVEGGKTVWMDIGKKTDIYIPRIKWLNDSQHLAIQRLNRDQNRLYLLFADITTGKSHLILTEDDPHGWVDYNTDITFLKDNRHFIWSSERTNWKHLYLYTLDGIPVKQLTDGNWDVVQLVRVDEKKKLVYFIGTRKSAIERHLYCVDFDGKGFRRLTTEDGWHHINMSPNCRYYIDVFSNAVTPPRTTLYKSNGLKVRILESGKIETLKDYKLSAPKFFTITTKDSLKLNAFMIKPVNFNSAKKYPVLIYTYGGPGSQIVRNAWGGTLGLWHQLMAQKGYIIFGVDNRGTGFKGNKFKNIVYRDIGLGVIDQINGAKYLKSLPYVDGSRIGIWGWSGGGWMTCMAMTKGAKFFKTGVAVAPVTDFRNYDTIWTERYMDQPRDNEKGYDDSNPINYVDNYSGGLLLIHGTSDDNVHMSNTMQLAYALENARKPFDLMIYPRKLHGIGGINTRVHLFNKITEYILRNL